MTYEYDGYDFEDNIKEHGLQPICSIHPDYVGFGLTLEHYGASLEGHPEFALKGKHSEILGRVDPWDPDFPYGSRDEDEPPSAWMGLYCLPQQAALRREFTDALAAEEQRLAALIAAGEPVYVRSHLKRYLKLIPDKHGQLQLVRRDKLVQERLKHAGFVVLDSLQDIAPELLWERYAARLDLQRLAVFAWQLAEANKATKSEPALQGRMTAAFVTAVLMQQIVAWCERAQLDVAAVLTALESCTLVRSANGSYQLAELSDDAATVLTKLGLNPDQVADLAAAFIARKSTDALVPAVEA